MTTWAEEAMDFAFFVPSAYSPHALHDILAEHFDVRRSHRHESGADQASVIMTTVYLYWTLKEWKTHAKTTTSADSSVPSLNTRSVSVNRSTDCPLLTWMLPLPMSSAPPLSSP